MAGKGCPCRGCPQGQEADGGWPQRVGSGAPGRENSTWGRSVVIKQSPKEPRAHRGGSTLLAGVGGGKGGNEGTAKQVGLGAPTLTLTRMKYLPVALFYLLEPREDFIRIKLKTV